MYPPSLQGARRATRSLNHIWYYLAPPPEAWGPSHPLVLLTVTRDNILRIDATAAAVVLKTASPAERLDGRAIGIFSYNIVFSLVSRLHPLKKGSGDH